MEGVKGENIVALCDVDEKRLGAAAAQFRGAKTYRDFRKMLDAMHRQIDAVVVSTPDHTHALPSLTAMRLGKHVYCEKPLAWSIEEVRLMAATARQYKVATQMGTQGMANDDSRAAIEVIRSGVLGEARELHVWTDRATTWWPQGIDRPADRPPTPKNLDWDLWLGGAPAALPPGLRTLRLAGLEGFRHRAHRRHGNPQRRRGLYALRRARPSRLPSSRPRA